MRIEQTDVIEKADLHLHTEYSDGKYSVPELIKLLKQNNIKVFSITDHDTIDGIYELKKLIKDNEIKYIPGIEFSTEYDGREVHILAYNIDYENYIFKEHVIKFRKNRIDRILKIIDKLNYLGLKFLPDDFFRYFKNTRAVGRPHVAEYIHKLGYVKSYQDAFNKYIGDFKVAFYKKNSPDTLKMLKLIRETGGISVLAHPGKNFLWSKMDILLKAGLEGIEIYHPTHKSDKARKFEKFAIENNLFMTGGSDFHGLTEDETCNIGKIFIDIKKVKFLNNINE
ncbi:MAG: PHP domain-containing protein [Ignavibacteria bacterium]|nr:PHP domain-containing protein [Ignavibacteria bacterium]